MSYVAPVSETNAWAEAALLMTTCFACAPDVGSRVYGIESVCAESSRSWLMYTNIRSIWLMPWWLKIYCNVSEYIKSVFQLQHHLSVQFGSSIQLSNTVGVSKLDMKEKTA